MAEEDLVLYLKDLLNHESSAAIEAHLGSCPPCAEKLAEQDKCLWYLAEVSGMDAGVDPGERRREPRVVIDEPASLQVLTPFSVGAWDVRIVNVSKDGLRAHTPKHLYPGSLIRVRMKYSVACGDVRYCIPAEQGFYVGVRMHDYTASTNG